MQNVPTEYNQDATSHLMASLVGFKDLAEQVYRATHDIQILFIAPRVAFLFADIFSNVWFEDDAVKIDYEVVAGRRKPTEGKSYFAKVKSISKHIDAVLLASHACGLSSEVQAEIIANGRQLADYSLDTKFLANIDGPSFQGAREEAGLATSLLESEVLNKTLKRRDTLRGMASTNPNNHFVKAFGILEARSAGISLEFLANVEQIERAQNPTVPRDHIPQLEARAPKPQL